MARRARVKSSSGIYHVMIRGINKEKIFISPIHKTKLLNIIKEIKEEIEFSIIAYCIMDNHLHLLIKDNEDNLAVIMKKLNVKYAMYYNKVHDRYGYVFQNRFRSEAVENEGYLLGVLRYIHNNPVKANIINDFLSYNWSSAIDYLSNNNEIVCEHYMKTVLNFFSDKREFINFHKLFDNNLYIDTTEETKDNIQYIVQNAIEEYSVKNGVIEFKHFSQEHREALANILINMHIITLNEVASLCNLSLNNVKEINKHIKNN